MKVCQKVHLSHLILLQEPANLHCQQVVLHLEVILLLLQIEHQAVSVERCTIFGGSFNKYHSIITDFGISIKS